MPEWEGPLLYLFYGTVRMDMDIVLKLLRVLWLSKRKQKTIFHLFEQRKKLLEITRAITEWSPNMTHICILAIRCLLWTPNYITADYVFRQHKIGKKIFSPWELSVKHTKPSRRKRHWTWNQHIDLERISQSVYSSIVWWFILNRMSCNNTILSLYCNTNRTDTLSTQHISLLLTSHKSQIVLFFVFFEFSSCINMIESHLISSSL